MILTDLYPTQSTIYVGATQNQYQEELTARAGSLPRDGDNFPTPYAYTLGYISYDNLPLVFKHNRVTVTQSDNDYKILAEEDTVKANYPIGYTFTGDVYGDSARSMIYPNESGNYIYESYLASYQNYINNLHPEYSGYSKPYNSYPSLSFLYCVHDSENNYVYPPNNNGNPAQVTVTFYSNSLQEVYDFLNGTGTKTITIPSYGEITINAEDFNEPVGVDYTSTTGYIITLYLNGYTFHQGIAINGTLSATVNPAITVRPTYDNNGENEDYWMVGNGSSSVYQSGFGLVQYSDHIWHYMRNWISPAQGIPVTGASGEFLMSEVQQNRYMVNGNIVAYSSAYRIQLYAIYTLDDILKHFSLMYRVNLTNETLASYVNNKTYATDVTENNEFLAKLKTGDISDSTFKNGLRPWQYSDFQQNEFDPDKDVPPYKPPTPPGPTPQETEPKYPGHPTLGSATRYIPTAGVNFYALNSSLVSSFIQILWSQPKNFYEAIQIAGNQVDSIFDYIQSFRYYPLNYDFSTSNTYPVIFGTGAVLKDADGNTNFQLSEAAPIQETIAAGDWNLSDPIYHWRNNFLDYSPYLKMSIYLPFAGTIELSPEAVASNTDISAATITLLASFDIETGTITYYVINQANVILAQKTAKIAIDLPLSGNNAAEQSAAILRAQFSTVKQLLGTGASAASSAAMGAATGGPVGAGIGLASTAASTLGSLGDMYLQNSLAHKAVPVEIQGMGGAFSALAGGQYPYITINRQKVSNPPNYAHTTGYLVEGTYRISGLNGFTVCRNVDVTGITQATDKEKAQIKQILESGFYA